MIDQPLPTWQVGILAVLAAVFKQVVVVGTLLAVITPGVALVSVGESHFQEMLLKQALGAAHIPNLLWMNSSKNSILVAILKDSIAWDWMMCLSKACGKRLQ